MFGGSHELNSACFCLFVCLFVVVGFFNFFIFIIFLKFIYLYVFFTERFFHVRDRDGPVDFDNGRHTVHGRSATHF
jgi:hypothetical protein